MTFRKFKWSYDEEVLKMTKSSKKLTAFGIALALAILIGGFLLHPWERTKSELTVTKVEMCIRDRPYIVISSKNSA